MDRACDAKVDRAGCVRTTRATRLKTVSCGCGPIRERCELLQHLNEFGDYPALAFFELEAFELLIERLEPHLRVLPLALWGIGLLARVLFDGVAGAGVGCAETFHQC